MAKTSNKKTAPGVIPLGDRVLVKPLEAEEVTAAGIIIPDTANKEKADRGEVLAVGEGKFDESGNRVPMQVKKGDMVIFSWGEKVEIDNEEYYLISESNILGIIK